VAFLAAVLAYLPRIESLSAFAVNVTLQKNLDRAEEIIARLRNLSLVNARIGYTTLAWGNRWAAPKAVEKQRILDAIDDQLAAAGVTAEERNSLKGPYVRFIAVDFYNLFVQMTDYAASRRQEALAAKQLEENNDANRAALQTIALKIGEWRGRGALRSVDDIPLNGFRTFMHNQMPKDVFPDQETRSLLTIADKISDLFEACNQKGGYTPEAANSMIDTAAIT
jgi:hypothetical protein